MKFDMHTKNIKNIKFNGQIFKILTKKEIYEKFEKFISKLVWRETLFMTHPPQAHQIIIYLPYHSRSLSVDELWVHDYGGVGDLKELQNA